MATAGELHRAVDLLEFAYDVRRGKQRLRSGWKGRTVPNPPPDGPEAA